VPVRATGQEGSIMLKQRTVKVSSFSSVFAVTLVASTTVFGACAEDPPGLSDPAPSTGGTGGGTGGTGN
jgi:hypothetical protein